MPRPIARAPTAAADRPRGPPPALASYLSAEIEKTLPGEQIGLLGEIACCLKNSLSILGEANSSLDGARYAFRILPTNNGGISVRAGTHRAVVRFHALLPTGIQCSILRRPRFCALSWTKSAKTCLNTKPARGRIAGACRFKDSGNCDERREAIDDLRRVGKSALDSVPCF
jgi:hypothetical protein